MTTADPAPPPPRLLVLLCTHQGERYLPAQLRSLAAQTLQPTTLVVHDWASTDGTRALLQQFAQAQTTAQTKARNEAHATAPHMAVRIVLHDEAPGPCRSFLGALDTLLSEGDEFDLLLPCDQDDLWHPDKLRCLADAWSADRGADVLYSDVRLINAQGQVLAPSYIGPQGALARQQDVAHASSLFVNVVPGMAMALTRRFLTDHRQAWQWPQWVMHDWAWIIVAHLSGARVLQVPQALVDYRQHGANAVGSRRPGALRTPLGMWRQARQRVGLIQRQYRQCSAWPGALPQRRPRWPLGRLALAGLILRGRHFGPLRTLKVALGIALLWPGRGTADGEGSPGN